MNFLHDKEDNVEFDLILIPRSSFVKLSGIQNNALKLRVCSPPIDNKANIECLNYFSKIFSVPKRDVQIIKGHKSRRKTILVHGLNSKRAEQVINEHLVER